MGFILSQPLIPRLNATFTKMSIERPAPLVDPEPTRETLLERVRREADYRDALQAISREAPAAQGQVTRAPVRLTETPPTSTSGFPTPSFPSASFDAPSSGVSSSAQRAIDSATAKFDARSLENSGRYLGAVEASEKHPLHSRLLECRMRARDPGIVAGREGVQARQQLMDCLTAQR